MGALEKRIASILTRSRKNSGYQKEVSLSDSGQDEPSTLVSWVDLYRDYSSLREDLGVRIQQPSIRVSATKQFGRLLAAENACSYRGRYVAGNRRR